MSKPRIAFLGLGIMGAGMARRLIEAGYPVVVFNRGAGRAEPLTKAGAAVAPSPREAAPKADIVISMVADDSASRAVWLGRDGALASVPKGALCIESSTVTVDWTRELASAARASGCDFLDAPVTGSRNHAAAGELRFLVGGSAAALEKAKPVLAVMGKTITHVGPSGSGAMIKLIKNFVCGVQIASLAEAITMIERSGLDRARAMEVLTHGAPGSPLVRTISERITAADYTPNFSLKLMTKDLGYAIREGRGLSLELATAAAALGDFQKGVDSGLGESDMAAVIEPMRKR